MSNRARLAHPDPAVGARIFLSAATSGCLSMLFTRWFASNVAAGA
jgi:hypothetical protein